MEKHLKKSPSHVLKSPFGLSVLPTTFKHHENIIYFKKEESRQPTVEPEPYEYFLALSPIAFAVFIFVTISIFLLLRTELDVKQLLFLSLNVSTLLYLFSFIDYLTDGYFRYAFYASSFLISVPFIYFFFSLLDKKHSWIPAVLIVPLTAMILFWFRPLNAQDEVLLLRLTGLIQLCVFLYCSFLIISYVRKLKKNLPDGSRHLTKRETIKVVFASLFLCGFCTSSILFSILTYVDLQIDTYYNAFFFLPAFSVGLYTVLAPRFGFVLMRVVVHEFLFKIFFIIFFILLYLFFIGFSLYSLFDGENSIFLHLTIIIFSFIVLDPIRAGIAFFIDHSLIKKNVILSEYLSQISYYLNDPHNIATFLNKIIKAVEEGLEVSGIKFYFASNLFKGIQLQGGHICYDDSPWKQIQRRKKIARYPVFVRHSGGEVGRILKEEKAFLLIGFQNFDAALLVPYKASRGSFFSSDIRFLRSLLKYGESLLKNYQFLLETTKIRRYQNELSIARGIQEKILPSEYENKRIKICFIILPFQQVTGDYIDFFEKNINEYTIFLGDVSGHGLGSAYLMTMIHSMIRASIKIMGEKLNKTFSKIDHYLVNEYHGHDFISLVGIKIQIKKKGKKEYAELQFINAGQHPILIYLMESNELEVLSTNQRVLGVIDTEYRMNRHFIHESFRVFAYSDGIFEIFDQKGKIIGEKEVQNWILESSHLKVHEQKTYIFNKIQNRGKKFHVLDDVSLIIAEVTIGDDSG